MMSIRLCDLGLESGPRIDRRPTAPSRPAATEAELKAALVGRKNGRGYLCALGYNHRGELYLPRDRAEALAQLGATEEDVPRWREQARVAASIEADAWADR